MSAYETFLNYRCPRYETMPTIEIYKDQLVSVLEDYMSPFYSDEKIITSSMINNYVKLKIINPPVNKKYNREHLAFLYVICILKKFFSITKIHDGINLVLKKNRMHKSYDMFCDELENALQITFGGKPIHEEKPDSPELRMIKSTVMGLANFVYTTVVISEMKNEE